MAKLICERCGKDPWPDTLLAHLEGHRRVVVADKAAETRGPSVTPPVMVPVMVEPPVMVPVMVEPEASITPEPPVMQSREERLKELNRERVRLARARKKAEHDR